ncbi:hypothetical protein WJU16_15530 [Chitinophaga pollutisoli]|uniref:Lipoprotein n=1 Tax=Chitinophaga pollutisoli TaxID=3133966 RepID=A0ABZ2YI68_9BACT
MQTHITMPRRKTLFRIWPVLLAGCFLSACTSEQAPEPSASADCASVNVTTTRIYEIVQQNCTNRNCHPGGSSPLISDFSTPAKLKNYISANGENWMFRVTHSNADMPQSQGYPALSRAVRDSIACWVNKGMPD